MMTSSWRRGQGGEMAMIQHGRCNAHTLSCAPQTDFSSWGGSGEINLATGAGAQPLAAYAFAPINGGSSPGVTVVTLSQRLRAAKVLPSNGMQRQSLDRQHRRASLLPA
ncbi:MAG: hypothetical protein ACPIOQ_02465 [Promethearchaeia archaeon]